jgi:hypothetical protein
MARRHFRAGMRDAETNGPSAKAKHPCNQPSKPSPASFYERGINNAKPHSQKLRVST